MPQVNGTAATAAREPEQLSLFEGGIDLAALRKERAALAARKYSAKTIEAYFYGWKDFQGWCVAAGRASLPASADTVSLYLVDEARRGLLPSTIALRLAAIAHEHLAAGHASPAAHADVREVLSGIRRKLGTAPRHRKRALVVEELRAISRALPADERGVRDRCIFLVGFASACRRSELSALDVGDVRVVSDGLVLNLRRSKTDQKGEGREVPIPFGAHKVTCPVRAFEAWMEVRGRAPGPVFLSCDLQTGKVSKRRLRGPGIAAAVKAGVALIGLDPAEHAGHSLRSGCLSGGARNGASALTLMNRSGHKSAAMVERYVRHGSLFAVDLLEGVL